LSADGPGALHLCEHVVQRDPTVHVSEWDPLARRPAWKVTSCLICVPSESCFASSLKSGYKRSHEPPSRFVKNSGYDCPDHTKVGSLRKSLGSYRHGRPPADER